MRTIESQNFLVHELADGVFAALDNKQGCASSNCGIVDLGGRTLVFDTSESLRSGAELNRLAQDLTGQAVTMIFISHRHADHWTGNQEFPENARIHATPAAYRGMQAEIEDLEDPAALEAAYRETISQTENLLAAEKDDSRIAVLQSALRRNRCGLEELPRFSPRLPDLTFGSEMVIRGEKRSVTFRPLPPAHTDGDCLMQIDEEPILFLGDVGFFRTHPFMVGCDPIGWIHQLEELEKSAWETLVPGHGPLGGMADLRGMREYIQVLGQRVVMALMQGKDNRSVLEQPLPDICRGWEPTLSRYQKNINYLFEHHRLKLPGEKET
jgi:glyoxylase-like metal-dependent hydrolase (beta-lactamase superfamily II)